MSAANALVAKLNLRPDAAQRYNLYDVHRAAGAMPMRGPKRWLSYKRMKALVAAIEARRPLADGAPVISRTDDGIFVESNLVIAYAMFVSPKFHLMVIRTMDGAAA